MPILEVSIFLKFASVMLAAYKLVNDEALYNQGEAIVTIVNEGKALAAVKKSNLAHLARQLAEAARQADDAFSEDSEALEDARNIFGQVAPYAFRDPSIFAGADLDVAKTTDAMVAEIKSTAHCRDFAEGNLNERYFREVCHLTLGRMLADKAYIDSISPHLWRETLERQGVQLQLTRKIDATTQRTEAKVNELNARIAKLEDLLEKSHDAQAALESGVSKAALIRLVRPIAEDIDDIPQAMIELTRAVEIARKVQEEGRHESNLGDFVDEVLERTRALSASGEHWQAISDLDQAISDLDEALEREEAESAARKLRLLSRLIDEHLLLRDAKGAAREIARRTEIDTDGQTNFFRALTSEQETWMSRGSRQGTRIDLEVAVELARLLVLRARNRRQRGLANDRLGLALRTLGELTANIEMLTDAQQSFVSAREHWHRDRDPNSAARSDIHAGGVIFMKGVQSGRIDEVQAAIRHYRRIERALPDPCRGEVLALLKGNQGIARSLLGEREQSQELLGDAIDDFNAAIKFREILGDRQGWAECQFNLGNAWVMLGWLQQSPECGREAVRVYGIVSSTYDREKEPSFWAKSRHGLGIAQTLVGEVTPDETMLQNAIDTLQEVIEVRSVPSMRADQMVSESAQGRAKIAKAELTDDRRLAEEALKQLVATERALRECGHILYADNDIVQIERAKRFLGWQS